MSLRTRASTKLLDRGMASPVHSFNTLDSSAEKPFKKKKNILVASCYGTILQE